MATIRKGEKREYNGLKVETTSQVNLNQAKRLRVVEPGTFKNFRLLLLVAHRSPLLLHASVLLLLAPPSPPFSSSDKCAVGNCMPIAINLQTSVQVVNWSCYLVLIPVSVDVV